MTTRNTRRDNLTREQRSYCMSQVKSKNTSIELAVIRMLHRRRFRFRKHVAELHGCPDIVFDRAKIAVFIDGDYWHGWHFSKWRKNLTVFWREKIEKNRQRDVSNFRKLRRQGWLVIRIWQHEIKRDTKSCVDRIQDAVRSRRKLKGDN